MLPIVATLVMGSLSKQTGGGERLEQEADGASLLGSLFGTARSGGASDLLGMAGKLLR